MALKDSLVKMKQMETDRNTKDIAKNLDSNFELIANEVDKKANVDDGIVGQIEVTLPLEKIEEELPNKTKKITIKGDNLVEKDGSIKEIEVGVGMTKTTTINTDKSVSIKIELDSEFYDKKNGIIKSSFKLPAGVYLLPFKKDPTTDLDSNERLQYLVGANHIEVYYDGVKLVRGEQWREVGNVNQASNYIELLNEWENGASIEFITTVGSDGKVITEAVTKLASDTTKNTNDIINLKDEIGDENTPDTILANIKKLKEDTSLNDQPGQNGVMFKDSTGKLIEAQDIEVQTSEATIAMRTNGKPIIKAMKSDTELAYVVYEDGSIETATGFKVMSDGSIYDKNGLLDLRFPSTSIPEMVLSADLTTSEALTSATDQTHMQGSLAYGLICKIWELFKTKDSITKGNKVITINNQNDNVLIELPTIAEFNALMQSLENLEHRKHLFSFNIQLRDGTGNASNDGKCVIRVKNYERQISGADYLLMDLSSNSNTVRINFMFDLTNMANPILEYAVSPMIDFYQSIELQAGAGSNVVGTPVDFITVNNQNKGLFSYDSVTKRVTFNGKNNTFIKCQWEVSFARTATTGQNFDNSKEYSLMRDTGSGDVPIEYAKLVEDNAAGQYGNEIYSEKKLRNGDKYGINLTYNNPTNAGSPAITTNAVRLFMRVKMGQ